MRFIAKIADIKKVKEADDEYKPYIEFRAKMERRELSGDELVVILNVETTTSYIPVFLDKEKSIEDVEAEVKESGAELNKDSRRVIEDLLKNLQEK